MRIRFIFHHGKDSFVGKAIIAWTGFLALFYNWRLFKYPFSHVSIWIPDENGNFATYMDIHRDFNKPDNQREIKYLGQCFSSTTRGKANGVRFAPASEVLKHPERWSYIKVEVDLERLEIALEEAKKLVGRKYDFWGIFGFIQPFVIQDEKRWYCSEIINWFAVLCGIAWHEKRISPRRLAYVLAKKYGEPKPLV